MNVDDFFEEDEPVEKIQRAFEQGAKIVTAAPSRSTERGQTRYLGTGLALARPSESLSDSLPAGQPQRH